MHIHNDVLCAYTRNSVKLFKIIHIMSVFLQILAVEILQHKFNIEKMVKILELLQMYTEDGETLRLQVS